MMKKPAVVYSAVYDDEAAALAGLEVLERLYDEEWIGDYDAAVFRMELGEPHIVKRVDHPRVRVIPELVGHGALPEHELRQAADELPAGTVGLIAVGEVSLERAFEDALTGAARSAQREFTTTTDRLASDLIDASQDNSGARRPLIVPQTEFEQEEHLVRQQAAERLADIAYALSAGVKLELRTVEEQVSVPIPETVVLKRRSTSSGDHVAVEVKLSWST